MRFLSISLALLLFLISLDSAYGQNPTRARTEDGRDVILFPDGTWKYVDALKTPPPPPPPPMEVKPSSAKTEFKTQKGQFSLWVNMSKWQLSRRTPSSPAEYQFAHKNGDAYAMIIPERLSMPLESLKEIVLENAREAAPDAKIVSEEVKMINGQKVLSMMVEGTIKSIPFIYYGYYYAGEAGTVQVITYTGKSLFKEYEQDFKEFLNGIEIHLPAR